jgi:hypothetical protein
MIRNKQLDRAVDEALRTWAQFSNRPLTPMEGIAIGLIVAMAFDLGEGKREHALVR